jgi:hypothetical protein
LSKYRDLATHYYYMSTHHHYPAMYFVCRKIATLEFVMSFRDNIMCNQRHKNFSGMIFVLVLYRYRGSFFLQHLTAFLTFCCLFVAGSGCHSLFFLKQNGAVEILCKEHGRKMKRSNLPKVGVDVWRSCRSRSSFLVSYHVPVLQRWADGRGSRDDLCKRMQARFHDLCTFPILNTHT